MHHRILANMPVKASWVDEESGKRISVEGITENVGETSTLVNLELLPPVGSEVRLKILEEDKPIIEVSAQVIRVERRSQQAISGAYHFGEYEEMEAGSDRSGREMGAQTLATELRRRMG
jgi:hypothetical protein